MEIVINVIKTLGVPILSSRDVISVLKKEVRALKKEVTHVVMDFDKVEFISRSAADELIKFKETSTKDILFSGLSADLVIFLRSVAANKAYPMQEKNRPKIEKRSLSELMG